MNLPFAKMHGLGNDFVLIDERRTRYNLAPAQLRSLADRREGIGCDQILFLEQPASAAAAARYRVANADGSPAEHCGNGIRCVARYLQRCGEITDTVQIEVGEHTYQLAISKNNDVVVEMGSPQFEPEAIPLAAPLESLYSAELGDVELAFGAVSVGNPHATIEVDDVAAAAVATLGPALQASAWFPSGVNVGFMEIVSPKRIRLRVYERGSGETRACGTGACAAVAIGRRWGKLESAVNVELSGGELVIEWAGGDNDTLWMTGPATHVYQGNTEL